MRSGTIVCWLALMSVLGCGAGADKWKQQRPKTVTAKGRVTLNGDPLSQAQVVLVPDGGTHGASALSGSDGSFQLQAFPPDDGVVPGNYKVMVVKSIVPETQGPGEDSTEMTRATLQVPKKYTSPDSSGLKIEIAPAGNASILLELTGKPGQ